MVQFNYAGLSKSSGVYVIFNNHNWRIYVGSTKEFKHRWVSGHYKTLVSASSTEAKQLRSKAMKDVWKCPEFREKMRNKRSLNKTKFLETCFTKVSIEARRQSRKKLYGQIISSSGDIFDVWSLVEFCSLHKLGASNVANLSKLFSGQTKSVNGWRLFKPETIVIKSVRIEDK